MPLPFILAGAAAVAGIAGVAKGSKAISNNSKAKDLISRAERKYENAKDRLEAQRAATSEQLDSLGETKLVSWSEDIGKFVELFKSFKNINIEGNVELDEKLRMNIQRPDMLRNMETASLKAAEVMKAGVGSLGAGALAGIASYGGAMMFASASTGTAIASLSGAAAANATLAWFGGGSLAAGGLGMAGGSLVLGGIVAGPVLAVAGYIMAAKSEENLAKAEKMYSEARQAAEKMDTMTSFMEKVYDIARDYEAFILEFSNRFKPVLNRLQQIYEESSAEQGKYIGNRFKKAFGIEVKVDYTKLSQDQQQVLHLSWLMSQVLYGILTAPILTKEGNLDSNSYKLLESAQDSSQKLLEAGA